MRSIFLAIAGIILLIASVRADFYASGDSQVTGQVGIGTLVPQAQMHIQDDSTDTYALRVSSANGTVFFVVLPNGNTGIGLSAPQTHLDVNGTGDNADIALQLRVGNSSNTVLSQQIVFTSTAGTMGHSIVTQATAGQNAGNAVDFFLWNSTGMPNATANLETISLSVQTTSTASVHIDPVGTPNANLEVSNGACTGCGTIIRAAAVAPSSRERKTDIVYLDEARRQQALEDVQALKHATFRYKNTIPPKVALIRKKSKKMIPPAEELSGPVIRGLIYEDTPNSIHGPGKTVVLDARVLNLEMALQEADKKITTLEAQISELEKQKKEGTK